MHQPRVTIGAGIKKSRQLDAIAFARVELGLTEDQYLDMTPAQYAAELRQWDNRERRKWLHTALICATIANTQRDPKKKPKPFDQNDFVPWEVEE